MRPEDSAQDHPPTDEFKLVLETWRGIQDEVEQDKDLGCDDW